MGSDKRLIYYGQWWTIANQYVCSRTDGKLVTSYMWTVCESNLLVTPDVAHAHGRDFDLLPIDCET